MFTRRELTFALLVLLYFSDSSHAGIFQYTDDNGTRHFVDEVYLVPEKYRDQLNNNKPLPEINVGRPVAPSGRSRIETPSPSVHVEKRQTKDVEIFMTSWCPSCKQLMAFLDQKGISYTKYDIESNSSAKKDFSEIGGQGVPLTRIGNKIILGYNPEEIMRYVYD